MDVRKSFLIASKTYKTEELVEKHLPILTNGNKKTLFGIAMKGLHSGSICFSRYNAMPLPNTFNASGPTKLIYHQDVYKYPVYDPNEQIEWHVNFADEHLFGFYGGSLFAQDEMQVGEHPTLGSLREALSHEKEKGLLPLTAENGKMTPCLIRGVERRVEVAVDVNKDLGRPKGLYGNFFRTGSTDAITQAITKLSPPTISNFIAMEAPKYGSGDYSRSTITKILDTAYTSFLGAKCENHYVTGSEKVKCVIHTGNWGTGAYGGNKTIMALLQMTAAKMAGIYALVYHTFTSEFTKAYLEAETLMNSFSGEINTTQFIDFVEKQKFKWGQSDGN
jgi:hypothetical protein